MEASLKHEIPFLLNGSMSFSAFLAYNSGRRPVVVVFHQENSSDHDLIQDLHALVDAFRQRHCEFRSVAVSAGTLPAEFGLDLGDAPPSLPWIAGYYRGALLFASAVAINAESLSHAAQSAMERSDAITSCPNGFVWLLRKSDDGELATVAIEALAGDSTSLLDRLGDAALFGPLFGAATNTRTTFEQLLDDTCSRSQNDDAQLAIIFAPTGSAIWNDAVPYEVGEARCVQFKVSFASGADLSALVAFPDTEANGVFEVANSSRGYKVVPSIVTPVRVAEAVANGATVVLCRNWRQWRYLSPIVCSRISVDHVYLSQDVVGVVAALRDEYSDWYTESGDRVQPDRLQSYSQLCGETIQIYRFANGGVLIPVSHWPELSSNMVEAYCEVIVGQLAHSEGDAAKAEVSFNAATELLAAEANGSHPVEELKHLIRGDQSFLGTLDRRLALHRDIADALLRTGEDLEEDLPSAAISAVWCAAYRGSFQAHSKLSKLHSKICLCEDRAHPDGQNVTEILKKIRICEAYLWRRYHNNKITRSWRVSLTHFAHASGSWEAAHAAFSEILHGWGLFRVEGPNGINIVSLDDVDLYQLLWLGAANSHVTWSFDVSDVNSAEDAVQVARCHFREKRHEHTLNVRFETGQESQIQASQFSAR